LFFYENVEDEDENEDDPPPRHGAARWDF